MKINDEIRARARQVFQDSGMKIAEAARIISGGKDSHYSTFYAFLYGETKSYSNLQEFCDLMGIDIKYLIAGDNQETTETAELAEIIAAMHDGFKHKTSKMTGKELSDTALDILRQCKGESINEKRAYMRAYFRESSRGPSSPRENQPKTQ